MLCVPTIVAPSSIAGMGVFSATELPTDRIIWEYTDGVDWRFTPDDFERFPEPFRSRLRHYIYQEDSGMYVLCGDNAKFMNHSDEANCRDNDQNFTVTVRAIHAGEELTCDYRMFDLGAKLNGIEFTSG